MATSDKSFYSVQTQFVIRFNPADLTLNLQDLLFQEPRNTQTPQELVLPSSLNAIISSVWGTVTSFVALSNFFKKSAEDETPVEPENPPLQQDTTPEFARLAQQYLASNPLILSESGVGGTYFLQDPNGDPFAVFKPVDEEPGAPNNPKKLVTETLLPPGGGAAREVAAFYLDRGFAGVPQTYLLNETTTASHGTKTGSIQQYIKNDGESSEFGYSTFLVNDVHHIGTLDIRLFNLDRNGENILIRKEGNHHRLIPIDHAYILPDSINDHEPYFDWMYWPHAKQPFDEETKNYISSLDVDADATVLRSLGLSEESIRTMKVSTMLLKHCAGLGKNLFEIAVLMCRDSRSGAKSRLQEMVESAEAIQSQLPSFYEAFQAVLEKSIVSL